MQTATGFESYGSKPIVPMTMEAAIALLEANKGTCERHGGEPVRYVTAALGYERICHPCLTVITTEYTYVRFMEATNGTGNARLLAGA
jgi:hypothetical protein